MLTIHLALNRTMSQFRYDLSDSHVIITQADPRHPALLARTGTHYYDSYRDELGWSFRQARKLDLEKVKGRCSGPLDPDGVRNLFDELGVLDKTFLGDDKTVKQIIDEAKNASNPYP